MVEVRRNNVRIESQALMPSVILVGNILCMPRDISNSYNTEYHLQWCNHFPQWGNGILSGTKNLNEK